MKNPTSPVGLFNAYRCLNLAFCLASLFLAVFGFAAPQPDLTGISHVNSRPAFTPVTAGSVTAGTLTGTITTVAGGMSGKIPALLSNLVPVGVTRDAQGNIYVSDIGDQVVRRIDPSGNLVTVAGNATVASGGANGDGGEATQAQVTIPMGLAVDANRNLYIADSLNNRVRRVAPNGVITTFAGGGTEALVNNGDGGAATSASLVNPQRVTVDPAGNVYIADVNHEQVRKVDTSGTITTYAGKDVSVTGGGVSSGDGGPATNATFAGISGMTWMPDGSLLICDGYGGRIRRVDSAGIITTIAGSGAFFDSGNGGPAISAGMSQPSDVASDGVGGYWIAEASGPVRHVDNDGIISAISVPGLQRPLGVTSAADGGVLISDINSRLLYWHKADGANVIVAGNGSATFSGNNVPAIDASLKYPSDVAFDSAGSMYIADGINYIVRRVSPTGVITTFAGNGQGPCRDAGCQQYNGDGGPATQAILSTPIAVAVDPSGSVYIAEKDSSLVRKVDPTGIIATYAGGGTSGVGDNGPANAAQLNTPYGLTIAPDTSLIIADTFGQRVRRVNPAGIITTIAGNGAGGYAGDNGLATAAQLDHPSGVAFDSAGNLYIADFANLRVRKVATDGTISTVAGNGQADTGGKGLGDGLPATAAALSGPYSVAVDTLDNLYISDQTDHRIREVDTAGTISTVTGTGRFGYSGDGGPASSAEIWFPAGIALGPNGGLYFADSQNARIRAINAPTLVPLTSVVSRKSHGSVGMFDVYLPVGGNPGIECRGGDGNGNGEYMVVFTFANTLTGADGASIASGTGSVSNSSIDSNDAHNYVVNLTGVTNAQTITISLSRLTDSVGNFSDTISTSMGVLLGDANATGRVDAADVSAVRQQTLRTIDSINFRDDINASGRIDASDVSIARQQTLTSLP